MNLEINKNELFSRLFKVELSNVSKEIQNLWKFYDVYVEMIDDWTDHHQPGPRTIMSGTVEDDFGKEPGRTGRKCCFANYPMGDIKDTTANESKS